MTIFFFFLVDDLKLNNRHCYWVLNVNMNASVSIETHAKYDKPFILKEKKSYRNTYLKYWQNLGTLFLKL